jgi:hypothetical protein
LFRFHKLPLTWFDKSAIRRGYERTLSGLVPGAGG